MPLHVTDVDILKEYMDGVMRRADHHAKEVQEIALALTGAIVWRKDDERNIEVMTHDGDTKNVLWVVINDNRYAFSFNHPAKTIEMREGTTRGPVLHSFSNKTPLHQIHRIFEAL